MSATRHMIEEFHRRFNNGDTAGVLAMATDDVSVGGARGSGQGKQLLLEWVDRKTTTLTPQRWFGHGDTVAVEEQVEWHARSDGRVTDRTVWGMVFVVDGDQFSRIGRYANIGEAVTTFGLFERDELAAEDGGDSRTERE